jgi:phage gp45-like
MGRPFNFKKGVISFFDKFHNKRCFDLKKIIIINNLTLQVSKTNLVKFKETKITISLTIARINTLRCNIDLGTDHLTLTQNKEKQIILAYGKSEFVFL